MQVNKTFKFLFNNIYNNGKFTKLVVAKTKIKSLNEYYKKNFEKYTDYSDFLVDLGSLKGELEKSKSALSEFEKQFKRRMALQPAILNECFVAQTLANKLELENFIDADEKQENIPTQLFEALIKAKGGELEAALPRYIYFSNKKGIVLLQYGDSSSIDAVFVKDGYRVRLEIKEEKAKLGEYDLNYDENGKLLPTPNIIDNHSEYIAFIDKFNEETDVFSYIGRNYKIGDQLDDNLLNKIVSSVFDMKKIDLYILQKGNSVFAVPTNNLLSCVDVSESEIRTAGRNSYTVFTPNRLKQLINELGGTIENDIVTLPYVSANATKGRGKDTVTRYKINSLFLVKIENITIHENKVSFNLDKVKQNKATISIHLYATINKNSLADAFAEINY